MSESIDLQARVLEATVLHQTKIDADIRRAAEAKIWDEDNKYILGYLQQAVGVLAFPEVVEKQRSVLYQTKRYPKRPDRAEGMEIRPIRWIADNSETTQSQPARVRAAVGHAVLLSSRSEGVNGSLNEQGEDVEECFYALGLAVEVNDSFWFSSLFAKDPNAGSYKCGALYRLLTLEKYTNHVRDTMKSSLELIATMDFLPMKRSMWLAIIVGPTAWKGLLGARWRKTFRSLLCKHRMIGNLKKYATSFWVNLQNGALHTRSSLCLGLISLLLRRIKIG